MEIFELKLGEYFYEFFDRLQAFLEWELKRRRHCGEIQLLIPRSYPHTSDKHLPDRLRLPGGPEDGRFFIPLI
jgi:hypothetical protein